MSRPRRRGAPFLRKSPTWVRVLVWTTAVALALAGGITSLIWQSSTTWWIGLAMTAPLVLLLVLGVAPPKGGEHFQGSDAPWGPP